MTEFEKLERTLVDLGVVYSLGYYAKADPRARIEAGWKTITIIHTSLVFDSEGRYRHTWTMEAKLDFDHKVHDRVDVKTD